MQPNIFVVDDDETLLFTIKQIFLHKRYMVHTANNYNEAITKIDDLEFDLIFSDIILGGKTGIDFLREVKNRKLTTPVVLMTGFPNTEFESEAIKIGAYDYIPKPIRKDILISISKTALQYKSLLDENLKYKSEILAIFNSVKDGIITVDKDLKLLEINETAKDICGFSSINIKDMEINTIQQLCEGKCVEIFKETIKTKKAIEIDHVLCERSNNVQHFVSLSTFPLLDQQDNCNGCVMIVQDETYSANYESFMQKKQQFEKFDNLLGRSIGSNASSNECSEKVT